ncbi:MAG TPA: hypothetical protein VFQ75_14735 [Candidatus Limnocylindrales bacterium]|nr:hypothetical protein [Candidatus Limnocylindrales bacterium]
MLVGGIGVVAVAHGAGMASRSKYRERTGRRAAAAHAGGKGADEGETSIAVEGARTEPDGAERPAGDPEAEA